MVLGKLKDKPAPEPYVILPLATFSHRGKGTPNMPKWASEFYKSVISDTYHHDTSDTSKVLSPNQAVYSKHHKCAPEELIALATAFVVAPDKEGYIPANLDGYLVEESVDNVWNSYEHLAEYHQEYEYLLSTNIQQWNLDEVFAAMDVPEDWSEHVWCSDKGCSYGLILGNDSEKAAWTKVFDMLKDFFLVAYGPAKLAPNAEL